MPEAESARIARIRHRYRTGVPQVSIERAKYYTQSWIATRGQGEDRGVRVARAMKHVFENTTHYLDRDDRIAGCWTEHFFGIPVDIERGVFNRVFASELTTGSMVRHRGRSLIKALGYLVRKGALVDFVKNQVATRKNGKPPLDTGLRTMSRRQINPFQIDDDDLRILTGELLPFWNGKTIADVLERELIRSGLYSSDMHDFVVAVPGNTSRQVMMLSTCATIATIQGHVILDYEHVLGRGLDGMLADLEQRLEETRADPPAQASLTAQKIALEGVRIFATRLADKVESELGAEGDADRRRILDQLLQICRTVPFQPAATFRQAVQSIWTIKTAVELAHPVNLHCFGRLDQTLSPFFEKDLAEGRIDRSEALVVLEELLLKIMSQNIRPESGLLSNFYHRFLGSSPVTVGGQLPDGRDATNELTHLFLEAAHGSRAITNMSVRVHRETPDELLQELSGFLADGASSFSLFNDELNVEALVRRGIPERDARDYAIMGCVEATIPGKTGSMSANALQLMRLLDLTLRNGDSRILAGTIRGEGPRTGESGDFETFDDLLSALQEQGRFAIQKIVEASNLRDELMAEQLPAPCISAFMDGCLDSARDVTRGGARYDLSGISMINSIANLTDSLYVIKKLVFDEQRFSLRELISAIDADFVGYEKLLGQIRKLEGKWGNGNPECDQLAARVAQGLFGEVFGHQTFKGGPWVVYLISMITHTIDGRLSIASPDGRRAGVPYAASCNPANVERAGVTAALRSIAALPFRDVTGCAVNMKFHPTAVGETAETRSKWVSLMRTYFQLGGSQLQPTCISAETLREAREHPEQHPDLIVKVGGYSTYFVDLGREIQQEIIDRTEHRC